MQFWLTSLLFTPLLGALLILLARFVVPEAKTAPRLIALLASLVASGLGIYVFVMGFLADYGGRWLFEERVDWIPSLGIQYHLGVDGITQPFLLLTALVMPLTIIYMWGQKERAAEFFAYFLILETGLLGVFLSLDLFLFYVFWEVVLIPMYFIIAIWGGENKSFASMKFFIYTHVASLIMLLGLIAIFFRGWELLGVPTTDMGQLANISSEYGSVFRFVVFGALFIGFAAKMPSVPFHTWLPDAHVEAPTGGSVILAALLLKMGGYGLIRVGLWLLPNAAADWAVIMAVIGTVSLIYGAYLSLGQNDLKKMIAYSSVSHMGLVLLGISTLTYAGVMGGIYQMFAHGLITAVLFMGVGSIQHTVGTRDIDKLGGLGNRFKIGAALILVAFLASLGLPGFAGFVSEVLVFVAVFEVWSWWVVLPILTLVITAFYFLWAYQRALAGPEPENIRTMDIHDLPWYESWPMGLLLFVAAVFGFLPFLLTDVTMEGLRLLGNLTGVAG